jgi:hypothetical protein
MLEHRILFNRFNLGYYCGTRAYEVGLSAVKANILKIKVTIT